MSIVNVFEMARGAQTYQGDIPLARLERLAQGLSTPEGTVSFTAQGFRDALGRPALRLDWQTSLTLACDKCGSAVPVDLAAQGLFYFVPDEASLEREPIDDAPEEALVGSDTFDLTALLEDEVILALPISPRHDRCGAAPEPEVSEEAVSADRRTPFAGLAALRDELRRQTGPDGSAAPAAGGEPQGD